MDAVTLARLQFGLTIMFHYLFPPLSIGLGLWLVVLEALHLRTGDPAWETLARFWTRIFAVNFAMGVATGVVMEFQFGTNWSRYSRFVGDVFGSALAAEGIFAFFLESGFLAVLVFGWDRVGPKMHLFATSMVFLGSVFSSVWIVVANSWQQTPAGYHLVPRADGAGVRAEVTDFWAMVLSPSSLPRLAHVLVGCFVLGAFFVCSVSAWHVLRGRKEALARRALGVGLVIAFAASAAQGLAGHWSAETVSRTQPTKLAAFEGHFHQEPGTGAPMWIVGIPDVEARIVRGLSIPSGLSLLLHQRADADVVALDATPREDWPPVRPVFFAYHAMIGIGVTLLGLSAVALALVRRGRLFEPRFRPVLYGLVFAVPLPYVANEAGWVAAEMGRQPWVVYGLLRTRDAVSVSVPASWVAGSIVMFVVIYAMLFAVWLFVLNAKIQHGPDDAAPDAGRPGVLGAASALASKEGGLALAHGEDR